MYDRFLADVRPKNAKKMQGNSNMQEMKSRETISRFYPMAFGSPATVPSALRENPTSPNRSDVFSCSRLIAIGETC